MEKGWTHCDQLPDQPFDIGEGPATDDPELAPFRELPPEFNAQVALKAPLERLGSITSGSHLRQ
jgi:hypothetical protein